MNATDVINELGKRGGVADTEWHGEKLEMKTVEQRAEEGWGEGEQGQEKNNGIEPARFEIEIQDSKSKKQSSSYGINSNVPDGLQRQRPTANAVF
jgi:hypothetical protein